MYYDNLNKQEYIQSNKKLRPRKPWIAMVLSIFNSAIGQIYVGNFWKGILTFCLVMLTMILSIFLLLYVYPGKIGEIITVVIYISIFLIPILIAGKDAKKQTINYKLKRYNRWYIYFLVFYALNFGEFYFLKMFIQNGGSLETGLGSMDNTISKEDLLIGDMTYYGLHYPGSKKYIITYKKPERNDIILTVYYIGPDRTTAKEIMVVKRCIGTPGDTLQIINKNVYINNIKFKEKQTVRKEDTILNKDSAEQHIFPKSMKWNRDNYGPIIVPKTGMEIKITPDNSSDWKKFILKDNDIIKEDEFEEEYKQIVNKGIYIVKNDYVFIMGDNRDDSFDSRYVGFLKESDIIGKVKFIYFSGLDLYHVNWERIGTEVE